MSSLRIHVGLVGVAAVMAASAARADCFDYQADNIAERTIVRWVKETKVDTRLNKQLDGTALRISKWLGATDYIIVQLASADFTPRINIDKRVPGGQFQVRAQSWSVPAPKGAAPGQRYAEVHYSGRDAHRNGDGWVDIVLSAQGAPKGGYSAWIVDVEAISPRPEGYCNRSFLPFQGSHACDTCKTGEPSGGDCPPGTTEFLGNCV